VRTNIAAVHEILIGKDAKGKTRVARCKAMNSSTADYRVIL
jgi:hypothetical protein